MLKALNRLMSDAAKARDSHHLKLQNDRTAFAASMPDVFASVEWRGTRYTSRGRLPKGVSRETFKETLASIDTAKASWAEAVAAGDEGKYEAAVTKTNEIMQMLDAVKQTLGMSAA